MNASTETQADERTAYTDGLRDLADWLDANPQIPLPYTGSDWTPLQLGVWLTKTELATIVKALPGQVTKNVTDTTMHVTAKFGPVHVDAYSGRDQVCERVVVGTETVTIPAEPAHEAQPEQTVEREVVEWRCGSILDAGEPVSA